MSNYIEYNDKIAVHPGYYIKELVEESGLTQEDFAKRLGTTPKNLSILIRGEQNLSVDIAMKLSKMLGTSVELWLNLQKNYEKTVAEFLAEQELEQEIEVYKNIEYGYFIDNFGFDAAPDKKDVHIKAIREFLGVSSLSVLKEKDLTVNFRSFAEKLNESNIIKANVMVQIAINEALKIKAPKFNKSEFIKTVEKITDINDRNADVLSRIQKSFLETGVVLIILPDLKGSGISGATKRINGKMLLMINDKSLKSDSFLFTLFHEIGHIVNGDLGLTFTDNKNQSERDADSYAMDKLKHWLA